MEEAISTQQPEEQPGVSSTPDLQRSYWGYVKRQYKKNRLAVWSLYFVVFLVVLALLADFIANEKPLIAKYKGEVYFPVVKQYSVDLGLSNWSKEFRNVNWKELDYDFAVWPLVPYLPQNLDLANSPVGPFEKQDIKSWRWRHWLGTDDLGRDVLAGMIHATRISLSVGIVAMGIAGLIGILLGSMAGYFGDNRLRMSRIRLILNIVFVLLGLFYAFGVRGYILADALGVSIMSFLWELLISMVILALFMAIANFLAKQLKKSPILAKQVSIPVDIIISRLIEMLVTIPVLFLIVFIVSIANPSIFLVMAVIGFTRWTGIARFIRAELLRIRSLEYIEAALSLGFSDVRILLKHAIPNSLSPVMIAIAFGIASAILVESTLSFLGLGVPADTVTWGSLLSLARTSPEDWWLAVFPGFSIFLTVTAFNLIAAGLTEALDPKLKS